MKINYLLFIALFFTKNVRAQGVHSSLNPLGAQLNPALTGMIGGNYSGRAQATHRYQWPRVMSDGAYTTTQFSVEQAFFAGSHSWFGVGVSGFYDHAGNLPLRQMHLNGNFSYIQYLGGNQRKGHATYLAAGVQLGAAQRRFDFSGIRWSEQFTGDGYNLALPNGEAFPNDFKNNRVYGDLGAGVALNYTSDKAENTVLRWVNIGGGLLHLNGIFSAESANISFFENTTNPLRLRGVVHAAAMFRLSSNLSLLPVAYFSQQTQSQQLLVGTYLPIHFTHKSDWRTANALKIGVLSRLNWAAEHPLSMDALMPSVRMDLNQFSFGLSYDINTSALRVASEGRGGFEFALCWRWGFKAGGINMGGNGTGKSKGKRPNVDCYNFL